MLVLVAIAICAATVPLTGGRLSALHDIKLRGTVPLMLALVIQVLIVFVFSDRVTPLHAPAHLASYGFAGVFFWLNRHVPGLWVTGLGGGLNLLAIAANGGVMPASPEAIAAAGVPTAGPGEFINSAVVEAPRLAWLGDVFALPHPWPMANVFSIGDILIVVGVAIVLHRVGGSRLGVFKRATRVPPAADSPRRDARGSPDGLRRAELSLPSVRDGDRGRSCRATNGQRQEAATS